MSKEEKKAIEWLKKADWFSARLYSPTILNLIENQQKEIEELKKYAEGYKLLSYSLDNFISKDKIKAKIEEIDIEIQCCEYADDDTEEYKQDIEKEKRRLLRDKAVLQSLLEEE